MRVDGTVALRPVVDVVCVRTGKQRRRSGSLGKQKGERKGVNILPVKYQCWPEGLAGSLVVWLTTVVAVQQVTVRAVLLVGWMDGWMSRFSSSFLPDGSAAKGGGLFGPLRYGADHASAGLMPALMAPRKGEVPWARDARGWQWAVLLCWSIGGRSVPMMASLFPQLGELG